MYKVKFYDTEGKLLCWYRTDNKREAQALVVKSKRWYADIEVG